MREFLPRPPFRPLIMHRPCDVWRAASLIWMLLMQSQRYRLVRPRVLLKRAIEHYRKCVSDDVLSAIALWWEWRCESLKISSFDGCRLSVILTKLVTLVVVMGLYHTFFLIASCMGVAMVEYGFPADRTKFRRSIHKVQIFDGVSVAFGACQ